MIIKNLKCNTNKIKEFIPVSHENTVIGDFVYRIVDKTQSSGYCLWEIKYMHKKLDYVVIEDEEGNQNYYPGLDGLYKIEFVDIG